MVGKQEVIPESQSRSHEGPACASRRYNLQKSAAPIHWELGQSQIPVIGLIGTWTSVSGVVSTFQLQQGEWSVVFSERVARLYEENAPLREILPHWPIHPALEWKRSAISVAGK
jgi:hypothetical protein